MKSKSGMGRRKFGSRRVARINAGSKAVAFFAIILLTGVWMTPATCDADRNRSKSSLAQQRLLSLRKAREVLASSSPNKQDRELAAETIWGEIRRMSKILKREAATNPSLVGDLGRWHDRLAKDFRIQETK